MSTTLVLGVGNVLLSDEGAGVHAMHYLATHFSTLPDTTFIDAGTLSFTLAADIASADNLLIFDAAQFDGAAGAVRLFEGARFDEFLSSGRRSVHEVGIADLMDTARLQGCLPQRRAMIGIRPEVLGWGDAPGCRVRQAMPEAAALAAATIRRWAAAARPSRYPRVASR